MLSAYLSVNGTGSLIHRGHSENTFPTRMAFLLLLLAFVCRKKVSPRSPTAMDWNATNFIN